jgi:mannose-6-phosphate isomerase
VEIMANSDNVLRGGLTSKNINVDELMKVLDFTPGFAGLVPCVEEHPGVWTYQTPAPEFALWRLMADGAPVSVPRDEAGRVLLVTQGSVTASTAAGELRLSRGESAFVTADDQVRVDGHGVVFVAGPGIG